MDTRIAHLDLDCFFVSVERIGDPSLRGKPVVVGGSPSGRGVVASASYEARRFGVHSAMPTARALRLCPGLIVVRGSHHLYSDYSNRLTDFLSEVSPVVERVSIDEMNLDLTGCESLYHNDLHGFLGSMKKDILGKFGLPCTIALASNKTLAKIAANTVKPDGLLVVASGEEAAFLAPLPVEVIPGVGAKTAEVLHRKGLKTIAQCQQRSEAELLDMLGKFGGWLHRVANGGGSVHVSPDRERKSISKEETFSADIADMKELESRLFGMVEAICFIMRKHGEKARTVTIKYRYPDFSTFTRQQTCPATDFDPAIFDVARELLRAHHRGEKPLRLLGVGVSNLSADGEMELPFEKDGKESTAAVQAADLLKKKFGEGIIHFAGSQ